MKKTLFTLLALLLIGVLKMNSQEVEKNDQKPNYEISFDAYQFLRPHDANISFSFDYLLNQSESIGLSTTYKFSNDYGLNFNYKHFFSEKYIEGLYVETGVTFGTETSFYRNNNYYRS